MFSGSHTGMVQTKFLPHLHALNTSAAAKVSADLKKYNPFGDQQVSSVDIRKGAINDFMSRPNITVADIVMRTGHDHKNMCAAFEHFVYKETIMRRCTRIQNDWPHPDKRIKSASFNTLIGTTFENSKREVVAVSKNFINNFVIAIVTPVDDDMREGGKH